ncbi:unnamed protein product [Caenorhabditis nigoni]
MDPPAKRFNVPQLPTVVLQNVMENFNPIELFNISQCSKKMRKNIKLAGTQKLQLGVDCLYSSVMIDSTWTFKAYSKKYEKEFDVQGSRCFGDAIVPVSFNKNNEIISFWEDPYSGLNTVYFHLSSLFNCSTDSIELNWTFPIDASFSTIDYVSSHQSKIRILTIAAKPLTAEAVIRILSKIRSVEELNIYSEVTNVPEKFVIPFEAQSTRIFSASWITSDHFDSMRNCVSIELWESNLTNEDIQKFIDNWKQGQYPNLQWLHVKSFKFADNFSINGMETLEDTINSTFVSREMFHHEPIIHDPVQIPRNDGVVGLIRYYKRYNILHLLV